MKKNGLGEMKKAFNWHCKVATQCIKTTTNDSNTRRWHRNNLMGVADGVATLARMNGEYFGCGYKFQKWQDRQLKRLVIRWASYSNYEKY